MFTAMAQQDRHFMSVFAQASRRVSLALTVTLGFALSSVADTMPKRVVSVNLCTDQLAMLIAKPEQLISVSYLSIDPNLSAQVDAAKSYTLNHGLAEEIFVLKPDLVVAGDWGADAAIALLERLGTPIVRFPEAKSFDDVKANLLMMGEVLGNLEVAESITADFDARLAEISSENDNGPIAALYGPNGFMAGSDALSDAILRTAGYQNYARLSGDEWGGFVPLERLVMNAPDVLVTSAPYAGQSRAEDLLAHPALQSLSDTRHFESDGRWGCGTPFVLDAVENLIAFREENL